MTSHIYNIRLVSITNSLVEGATKRRSLSSLRVRIKDFLAPLKLFLVVFQNSFLRILQYVSLFVLLLSGKDWGNDKKVSLSA